MKLFCAKGPDGKLKSHTTRTSEYFCWRRIASYVSGSGPYFQDKSGDWEPDVARSLYCHQGWRVVPVELVEAKEVEKLRAELKTWKSRAEVRYG